MKAFNRWIVRCLCLFFVFIVDGGEMFVILLCGSLKVHKNFCFSARTKSYSSRYINDFNITSPFEPIYDYDNTKTEIEKVPLRAQDATKNDDNLEIYPDPEEFHRKMLNKSRIDSQNHHDDTVIKICKL